MYEMLPRQQYIDEIMLLACYHTLEYIGEFVHINPEGFIYFEQALRLQEQNSNAIPCEAYLFQRECRTIDELMYIQALLVYERLLPQRDETHLLIPGLIRLNDAYQERGEYNRCLLILTHVYQIILSCKENSVQYYNADIV